jgi:hypothetical protein
MFDDAGFISFLEFLAAGAANVPGLNLSVTVRHGYPNCCAQGGPSAALTPLRAQLEPAQFPKSGQSNRS